MRGGRVGVEGRGREEGVGGWEREGEDGGRVLSSYVFVCAGVTAELRDTTSNLECIGRYTLRISTEYR